MRLPSSDPATDATGTDDFPPVRLSEIIGTGRGAVLGLYTFVFTAPPFAVWAVRYNGAVELAWSERWTGNDYPFGANKTGHFWPSLYIN